MTNTETEVAVIGGGLVGSATAYGLARAGRKVVVLDEGDVAFRASRGNFALVWIQSKGMGLADYSLWSRQSAGVWPELAQSLRDETGVDVSLEQNGGFVICLSEKEMLAKSESMRRLQQQPDMVPYDYEVLDHAASKRYLPELGPDVVGSIYCPLDGHVNSLRLFRSLHLAMIGRGVDYHSNSAVDTISPMSGGFVIRGAWGSLTAEKVVLAAGLGNARLGPMVGLDVPVYPSKGQILVTEKAASFLKYPVATVRQTDEGSILIGDSQEKLGFDTVVTQPVISVMADRALRMFPLIGNLNVVRTWSALRVMSPDGFPIYEHSQTNPGAFVVTCHSGVTLAAAHALILARHIGDGALPSFFTSFNAKRFHVSKAA
jgi:glycine/D-amino acid oxidase-like deaminating enzyme